MGTYGRYGALTVSPELLQTLTDVGSQIATASTAVSQQIRAGRLARQQAQQESVVAAQMQAAQLRQQERSALAAQQAAIASGEQRVIVVAAVAATAIILGALYVRARKRAS